MGRSTPWRALGEKKKRRPKSCHAPPPCKTAHTPAQKKTKTKTPPKSQPNSTNLGTAVNRQNPKPEFPPPPSLLQPHLSAGARLLKGPAGFLHRGRGQSQGQVRGVVVPHLTNSQIPGKKQTRNVKSPNPQSPGCLAGVSGKKKNPHVFFSDQMWVCQF